MDSQLNQQEPIESCDCCPNLGPFKMFVDLKLCYECYDKEQIAQAEIKKPENVENRIQAMRETDLINQELVKVQQIDYSIETRNDIFNAETVAIVEIKKIIDADESISNKHYMLAKLVRERFEHFKSAIFELDKQKLELYNKQRADQTYLIELKNKLSLEEREKLRLLDVEYKPTTPVLKKSTTKAPSKKFDKIELAKYAGEAGLPLAAFQMICIQKNLTPKEAAEYFLNISKSVTTNEPPTKD